MVTHGTPQGYRKGCREECCRAAWREYSNTGYARRKAGVTREIKHGITRYTHYGCRCQTCGLAMREYNRKHDPKREARKRMYRPRAKGIESLTPEQELEMLIRDQEYDMQFGHKVGRNPRQVYIGYLQEKGIRAWM